VTVGSHITTAIANHGVLAVFVLMALDAVVPVGSELIMLYAGVLAAGAAAGANTSLLGSGVHFGAESYALLVASGTLGSLAGATAGYALGALAAPAAAERRPRWLPVSDRGFARAQSWFQAHERSAIFLGRITPVVRSVISIPAGVLRVPLWSYAFWSMLGALAWCLVFAGVGWALAGTWEGFHRSFRYADYVVVAALVALVVAAAVRSRRRSLGRNAAGYGAAER
jgi:membrane protein DedA with SNARE-associated domain